MQKVSIIVPVYRVPEKYLRKCLDSCLSQTAENIEVIVVHDFANDNCGDICDEYAIKDSRIKVIHKHDKTNGGLSAARNDGVRASTGEWIMFVDGDDWIESDMCQSMLSVGEANSAQLVMCGISRDYNKDNYIYKFYLEDGKVYNGEECRWLQQQLLVYNGNIAVAYSKLIRRDFLLKNNVFHNPELKQGAEGLEFNLRLFENLDCAVFINKAFYHYIYNDVSLSSVASDETNTYVIRSFEIIKKFICSSANAEALLQWFDNRLLYVIVTTAISGYFNPANKEPYKIRKKKYEDFLCKPIIAEVLNTRNQNGIGMQRKVVLFFVKHRMYSMLEIMGKMRRWQKNNR